MRVSRLLPDYPNPTLPLCGMRFDLVRRMACAQALAWIN
jgi:hypothetical protein